MKINSLLLLFAILVPGWANAKTVSDYGAGKMTCQAWTKDKDVDENWHQREAHWIMGFLTAYNYYGHDTGDLTEGIDGAKIWAWVDTYCRAHPLNRISSAAEDLVGYLASQQKAGH
jgi:hypothetical protein